MDSSITLEPDHVDSLLASELTNMSLEERGAIYEEVHGVDSDIVETPQLLAQSLRLMEAALQQQVPRLRDLYNQARQINPEYVDSLSFWLQFLRAENFVASKAALRLCRFLEGKVKCFGSDSLARPITLEEDFDPDDLAWLKGGTTQLLPSRDRSGRAVIGIFNMNPDYVQPVNIDSVFKTAVYLSCCMAEDEANQKRGIVGLYYYNRHLETSRRLLQRESHLSEWLPLRFVAGHVCYDDPRLRIINAILMLSIGRERRVRLRIHDGSPFECRYKLMSFGLPIKSLPVTDAEELKTTSHLQWLARRRIKETTTRMGQAFEGIDLPSHKDVLFGRGKTNQEHSGNILLRSIIAEHLPQYQSTSKQEKGKIALKVVLRIKQEGGRFLRRDMDYGWWFQVSDEAAREKISMSFRTAKSATCFRTESFHTVSIQKSVGVDLERTLKRMRTR